VRDGGGPFPGEELVELAHGKAITEALEDIFKISEGLDAVEFGGGEERGGDRPAVGAAVGTGEEMVLAAEGDGPDGASCGRNMPPARSGCVLRLITGVPERSCSGHGLKLTTKSMNML
jgi:hypothetical protein